MIKTIFPKLSPESEQVLNRLKSNGWNITWCIDTDLKGEASTNFIEQKISFRNQKSSEDSSVILHELLHLDLYDKGYPTISSKFGSNEFSIFMLNDVFQHIMISTEVEKAGSSIEEQEEPSVSKLIVGLTSNTRQKIPEDELFSVILYIRAHFLSVEETKILPLRKYIQINNKTFKTMDQISGIISRFPKANCSVDEYAKCLNNVLFSLDLKNEVTIEKKNYSSM